MVLIMFFKALFKNMENWVDFYKSGKCGENVVFGTRGLTVLVFAL